MFFIELKQFIGNPIYEDEIYEYQKFLKNEKNELSYFIKPIKENENKKIDIDPLKNLTKLINKTKESQYKNDKKKEKTNEEH